MNPRTVLSPRIKPASSVISRHRQSPGYLPGFSWASDDCYSRTELGSGIICKKRIIGSLQRSCCGCCQIIILIMTFLGSGDFGEIKLTLSCEREGGSRGLSISRPHPQHHASPPHGHVVSFNESISLYTQKLQYKVL